MIYEICVDSIAGVRAARAAGAHRVELCADLFEGGITPSLGMMERARAIEGIGLHIIIRPRGGDFLYDEDEFAVMAADIAAAKRVRADGVVLGLLNADGRIDARRTAELVALARPLAVTFHRAFDMAADPFEALEMLVELGIERVLTSGQEASVLEGLPLIAELVQRAEGRMIVMPGGGITQRNIGRILAAAPIREVHFAALEAMASGMTARRNHVFMGGELRQPEYSRPVTSSAVLRAVMQRS